MISGYLLQREDGAYVARVDVNPTGGSYTRSLRYARVYATRDHAEADRCVENERIIQLEGELHGIER